MESPRKSKLIRITVWAAALGLLLGVLSSLAMAGSADAHAVLKSISPKDGARLAAPPAKVVLSFNEPISSSFATVTVAGADGRSESSGKAAVSGVTVTQALAELSDGRYTVSFRVVSDDGHPISGRSTFTVAPAAATATTSGAASSTTAAPAPASDGAAATAPSATAAGDSGEDRGRPLRLGLAVGVAALAVAGGLALVARSRRDGSH